MREVTATLAHEYLLATNCILDNNFVLTNMEVVVGDPPILEQPLAKNGDILCP